MPVPSWRSAELGADRTGLEPSSGPLAAAAPIWVPGHKAFCFWTVLIAPWQTGDTEKASLFSSGVSLPPLSQREFLPIHLATCSPFKQEPSTKKSTYRAWWMKGRPLFAVLGGSNLLLKPIVTTSEYLLSAPTFQEILGNPVKRKTNIMTASEIMLEKAEKELGQSFSK